MKLYDINKALEVSKTLFSETYPDVSDLISFNSAKALGAIRVLTKTFTELNEVNERRHSFTSKTIKKETKTFNLVYITKNTPILMHVDDLLEQFVFLSSHPKITTQYFKEDFPV